MSAVTEGVSADDQQRLLEGMDRLSKALGRLTAPTASSSNVRIDAGGVGVWAATTACMVMLGVMFFGAIWMGREFDKKDRELSELRAKTQTQQDYLNAIYQSLPNLQKQEK